MPPALRGDKWLGTLVWSAVLVAGLVAFSVGGTVLPAAGLFGLGALAWVCQQLLTHSRAP